MISPPTVGEIVRLREYEGCTVDAIAALVGCSPAVAEKTLQDALRTGHELLSRAQLREMWVTLARVPAKDGALRCESLAGRALGARLEMHHRRGMSYAELGDLLGIGADVAREFASLPR